MTNWLSTNPFQPNTVGRTWMSPQGRRKVEQEGEREGVLYYAISTEGFPAMELLPARELEDEIRRDEANVASRARARATQQAEVAAEAERARWRGFTDSMTPRGRARADKVLSRQVSVRGEFAPRGAHVEHLVDEGYRVRQDPRQGRILESPTGSFFTERDLTKIGLDYAEFLS